jgi:hypothetical protein
MRYRIWIFDSHSRTWLLYNDSTYTKFEAKLKREWLRHTWKLKFCTAAERVNA